MLSAVKTFITTAQNNIMIIETNKQTMREREKSEYETKTVAELTNRTINKNNNGTANLLHTWNKK